MQVAQERMQEQDMLDHIPMARFCTRSTQPFVMRILWNPDATRHQAGTVLANGIMQDLLLQLYRLLHTVGQSTLHDSGTKLSRQRMSKLDTNKSGSGLLPAYLSYLLSRLPAKTDRVHMDLLLGQS